MRPRLIMFICVLILGVFGAVNLFAACIQDPVSYWSLDETTAPYANQVVGGPVGACQAACPTVDSAGTVGNAQSFSAVTSGIVIADDGTAVFDYTASASFSIGVWFRRPATAPWVENEVLVGRYQFGQLQFWLGLENTTGRASFRLWDNVSYGDLNIGGLTGAVNLADGQWHHLMAVRDAISSQTILYVDGVEADSIQLAYTGTFTGDAPMTIGWMNSQINPYAFSGSLDEVTLFNSALSSDIVSQIYDAGLQSVSICQDDPTDPVEITSTALTTATVGTEYVYAPEVSNPGGGPLSWSLENQPAGMSVDVSSGMVTWTPAAGTTTSGKFTLIVRDNANNSDTEDIEITVSEGSSGGGGSSSSGSSGGGCFMNTIFK